MATDESGAYRALVIEQHTKMLGHLTNAEKFSILRHSVYEWLMISAAISVLVLAYQQHKSTQQMVKDMAFMAANSEQQLEVVISASKEARDYRAKSDRDFDAAVQFDQDLQKKQERRENARERREIEREERIRVYNEKKEKERIAADKKREERERIESEIHSKILVHLDRDDEARGKN